MGGFIAGSDHFQANLWMEITLETGGWRNPRRLVIRQPIIDNEAVTGGYFSASHLTVDPFFIFGRGAELPTSPRLEGA